MGARGSGDRVPSIPAVCPGICAGRSGETAVGFCLWGALCSPTSSLAWLELCTPGGLPMQPLATADFCPLRSQPSRHHGTGPPGHVSPTGTPGLHTDGDTVDPWGCQPKTGGETEENKGLYLGCHVAARGAQVQSAQKRIPLTWGQQGILMRKQEGVIL